MVAEALLLYDGDCGFCQRGVRFLYQRDPRGRIHFASLQSEAGRQALREHGLPEATRDTMVLVHQGRALVRSTGALRAATLLRQPWRALAWIGLAVPRALRDLAYRWIAARRHRLDHARACPVPPAAVRERFRDLP